jgi:hypothetical protein
LNLRRIIDDNGFISMEIASKVSAPKNQQTVGIYLGVTGETLFTLLQKRDTSSG